MCDNGAKNLGEASVAANSARKRWRRLVECLEHRMLLASDVVINEIHYDAPDKTQLAEFIELYNNSSESIDLTGWAFTDGIDYQIPAGTTLRANEYLVVAQDPATTRSLFDVQAIGPWKGNGEMNNAADAPFIAKTSASFWRSCESTNV